MGQKKRGERKKISHIILPVPENGHHPHVLRAPAVLMVLAVTTLLHLGYFSYQLAFLRGGVNIASVLPGAITALSNVARAEVEATPLQVSPILTSAAQKKANDMVEKGYFAHQEPNGEMPWHWFTEEGYIYTHAGENLAVNFTDTKQLVDAWLGSEAHRDNILKPQYAEIGIGMATGTYKGREAVFVVQFLGARNTKPAELTATVSDEEPEEEVESEISTAVLGEQDTNMSATASIVNDIKVSPRTYALRALFSLIVLFAALLAFALMPTFRAHPRAVMNGFLIVAMLVFFYAFQDSYFGPIELPESQAANAVSMLE